MSSDLLQLDARESHHLIKVLRARVGERLEVLDGRGSVYRGSILGADAKAVVMQIAERVDSIRPAPRVTLLQSITKGKAMDLVLRMATEIGAACIQPMFTNHGEVQIKGDRLQSKVEKWEVLMIEACKQCGLPFLPKLGAPCTLDQWMGGSSAHERQLKIVASLEAGSQHLGQILRDCDDVEEVVVAVGPEGDFTPAEYQALASNGFRPVRLGANVLRAETAAAYILSVVDQHYRSI